ncbi:MAG: leucyl/phenylalanyl-tRNA--protein transferase [Ignavibacteria bacterium]|nr:leucyl/phenylalanyl-tRNA--protein transferase [Ignavibacteria bacterium]
MIEPEILLAGYASGYFPMAESREGEIRWYQPDLRGIIPLDALKISRSLHQTLKKNLFVIRLNTAFEDVMKCCAEREETWISEDIIRSYVQLHHLGYAHSVEAWKDDQLAVGLDGVTLGAAFFGESMFSRVRDASKVALIHLVRHLSEKKFELLDTQFLTPHLARLGAIQIPHVEYLAMLKRALRKRRAFLG